MKPTWGFTVARWIFAAFFAFAAGMRLAVTETAHWANPKADLFYSAVRDTQFLNPLLDALLLAGSSLLVFHRTAPLGIVVFAPMIMIFFRLSRFR